MTGAYSLILGDALDVLRGIPDGSVHCTITSPPYLDARPEYPSPTQREFALIFEELRRVTRGGLLLNVGRIWRDGCELRWWEPLLGAAEEAGWHHVDTLIWVKPNANPIKGRVAFTDAHEYVFFLGEPSQVFNVDAVRTPYSEQSIARYQRRFEANAGVKNNPRPHHRKVNLDGHPQGARPKSWVAIYTGRQKGITHPAPMALELAEHLVEVGSWRDQTVLDPFAGSGTTAVAALSLGRRAIAIERDPEFALEARTRLDETEERMRQLSLESLEIGSRLGSDG